MILTIDIGNSSISVGAFGSDGRLAFAAALETVPHASRDRCAMDLLNLFRLYGAEIRSVEGTDPLLRGSAAGGLYGRCSGFSDRKEASDCRAGD